MNKISPKFLFIAGIILFGAVLRLVPHWPNFTPVAAMALFGGAHFRRKELAFIIPMAALFLSDLVIGFHNFMIPVYLSFGLITILGMFLRGRINAGVVAGASVASSLLFFIITNFAVWAMTPFYGSGMTGLLACYTAGLPFLLTGMAGDLFYNAVFFVGFYLVTSRIPALAK